MNKLTKLLSVFVIAGAVGASVAGIAGCAKKDDGNNGGHTHNYTWVDDNNGKCHEHCSVDGCDAPDKPAQDHVWGDDNECDHCGATKPNTENPEGEVAPATADGIVTEWEGGLADITLSETNKTAAIDLSKVKVYYAAGSTKLEKEVPAANYEITVNKGGSAITELTGLKQGHYEIIVETKDVKNSAGTAVTWENFDELDILNPVKADSLAVKSGTLTQGASVQNKMSADWTYEVTLANGDKQDYTGEVTVTVDTQTVGEQTATLTSGNLTGTVKVIITEAVIHTETYAVNLSGKEIGVLADEAASATAVELFKSANGNTKLEARGVKVEANGNSAAKECDGKYFANRAPFAGATFTSTSTLQTNQRYFILTAEGPAKLTVYWSRNSSTDERGVSVFNSTVTNGDISALTPGATTIAKETLSGATSTQAVQKMEVNIPAAGTYWITTANNQNVYFYYIELTTEFEGEGTDIELEDGATTLANVKVSHSTTDYKQEFVVGDTFSVDSGYSIKGTYITANTAKKSEQAITDVTYWIGDTQLTPGETVLAEELFTALGDNTVTVKVNGETVTGSYTIFVDSAVHGVTGITASLKDGVNTEVADASATIAFSKNDVAAVIVGENTNATLEITSVKYRLKTAEAGSETEITESVNLSAGDYIIVVVATVTDSTTSKTAEFEATFALKISVAGAGASWLYQTDNATIGAANPDIAQNAIIAENSAFKAVALVSAKSGYNMDSVNFADKIADASNAPTAAAAQTASGEAITFTNAVAFGTKAGTGTDYLKITAKKATTVYVYLNGSDDKHGSNRAGNLVYYSINGTACSASEEIAFGNRKAVTVLKVTLAANDELVVSAKKSATGNDPRVWLYGIEAVDAV